eukprot:4968295-Lingulodinium_polyedra.AAC.1
MAYPTVALSPIHQYLVQGRKLKPALGLQWLQKGTPCSVLQLVAKGAFKGWNHEQVKKLMRSRDLVPSSPPSLFLDIAALARDILPGLSQADLEAILDSRGVSRPKLPLEELPPELLEELGRKAMRQEMKVLTLMASE